MVLCERYGVSERRACRGSGRNRSTQRKPCRPRPPEEEKLRRRLRAIARRHPRWGWRMAHRRLLREGWTLNRKRTRRLWRLEGLRRPPQGDKRRRFGQTIPSGGWPPVPTRCGPSTSNSTRPPTGGG